jgi:N-acylneuraminate cytidylyltransferase
MILGKKVLAVIPARGDSRKVSGKHLRKVAGRTLLGWSILSSQKSRHIDQLILSSDDLLIIQEAKNYGCDVPFLRPKHLARADISVVDAVLHAIDMTPGYEYIVVLQPSSPLRTVEDIDNCILTCIKNGASACVSVTEPTYGECNGFTLGSENVLIPTVPGQFLAPSHPGQACYVPNGAVAVAEIAWLQRERSFLTSQTSGYVMPRERSIDVDSEFDLWLVNSYKEYLAQRVANERLESLES